MKHRIVGVSLQNYTDNEIRKLSVVEVNEPETYNSVGRATLNGLADPRLGATREANCGTCSLSYHHCPGHFGLISLCLPVIQPLYLQRLMDILKSKCQNCDNFRTPNHIIKSYAKQLELLDLGMVSEAEDLREDLVKFLRTSDPDDEAMIEAELEQRGTGIYSALEKEKEDKISEIIEENVQAAIKARAEYEGYATVEEFRRAAVKTTDSMQVVALRDSVIKSFWKSKSNQCPHCKHKNQRYTVYEKVKIMLDKKFVNPQEALRAASKAHEKQPEVLNHIFGLLNDEGKRETFDPSVFFVQVMPVTPTKYRPSGKTVSGQVTEHRMNSFLKAVIINNRDLAAAHKRLRDNKVNQEDESLRKLLDETWVKLQRAVATIVNTELSGDVKHREMSGIKQELERKEGLFRSNMMGKRVNYSARTVITPDVNLEPSEIGVPLYFAKKLTYPQPVFNHNVQELREAVINGASIHPGANFVEEGGKLIDLSTLSLERRIAVSKTLLSRQTESFALTKVYRHLKTGDIVMFNRQPTLHKSSMMAHQVRILNTDHKTFRFHYANCSTYNADFDGDEMNIHFPQNELARAELYTIANNANQFIVPTSGKPIRGLIQDHVVSGVLLTKRDTFLNESDYNQLVYTAIARNAGSKRIEPEIPTILKPRKLWTGKQVITTVMNELTGDHKLNLTTNTKVPASQWGPKSEEGTVIFRDNELLVGVLDKNAFGANQFGLVHAVYECYGPDKASLLLGIFGRLFTQYLQFHGFSCGIDDMLIMKDHDKKRMKLLKEANEACVHATAEFAGLTKQDNMQNYNRNEIASKLAEKFAIDSQNFRALDAAAKSTLSRFTSDVIKACLPEGQVKSFPTNAMSLMTTSGAKGGMVNFSQISCVLGQQEFEGARVAPMASGKTLPSFEPFDPSARAGGYVAQRFLTGIKPQEYFFHTMAGREGLIDTACKTARSGYLQRCLMKHLEGLRVHYDRTVRGPDNSIFQFHYGEDSLDPVRVGFIDQFDFMHMNLPTLAEKFSIAEYSKKYKIKSHSHPAVITKTQELKAKNAFLNSRSELVPTLAEFDPGTTFGAISESFQSDLDKYIETKFKQTAEAYPKLKSVRENGFRSLAHLKYLKSLVDPGEAVGVIAAQSIGEPSTQMTLNTFHFAGLDMAHVTLGIPRLLELLKSTSVARPYMSLPMKSDVTRPQADAFATSVTRTPFKDILKSIKTTKEYVMSSGSRLVKYVIDLDFDLELMNPRSGKKEKVVSTAAFENAFQHQFIDKLAAAIRERMTNSEGKRKVKPKGGEDEEEDGAKEDEDADEEAGSDDEAGAAKRKADSADKASVFGGGEDEEYAKKGRKSKAKKRVDEDDERDEDEEALTAGGEEGQDVNNRLNYEEPDEEEDEEEKEKEAFAEELGETTASDIEDEEQADEDEQKPKKKTTTKKEKYPKMGAKKSGRTTIEYAINADQTCTVTFLVPPMQDMIVIPLVEKAAEKAFVKLVKLVTRAAVMEKNDKITVHVEGINFGYIFNDSQISNMIDLPNLKTNDVRVFAAYYGIEAARTLIIGELKEVFVAQGISVDLRHLNLIADYLTQAGSIGTFARGYMACNPSPFQRASFEQALTNIGMSALYGERDLVESPTARLVFGQVIKGGTGSFDIMQPLQ